MAPQDLVLVDTCIWIQFFNRPQSQEKRAVDELLDEDRVALTGPIVAEVLQGFPRKAHADWVASVLRGVHYLEVTWDHWRAAAHLGSQLASRGHQLPLSDLATAAVALESHRAVYSTDPDFDVIPNLKRFRPGRP
jgi:predicted nucleic acid-binding protein